MHNYFRLESEVNHRQFEHERRVKATTDEALVARPGEFRTRLLGIVLVLAEVSQLVRLADLLADSTRPALSEPCARS
jgi:hypothetical protein